MTLARGRMITWAVAGLAVVVAWILGASLLPSGMPAGIVLRGLVLGGLTSLTAMGLVILQRRPRSDRRRLRTEGFLLKGLGEGYGLRRRGEMDDYLGNPGSIGGHLGNVGWHDSCGHDQKGT